MGLLLERIADAKAIGIAGHIRPDGDCVGSCLALYNYVREQFPDKQVDCYMETVPKTFRFMRGVEQVKTEYETDVQYDLFVSLDSSSIDRLGAAQKYFDDAKDTLCIDHHISNTAFGKHNIVNAQASSTCEVLFEQLEPEKITLDIATALYIGIIFDTGVFKHTNTSRRTMEIAGFLMELGVPYSRLIDECFYQRTNTQTQLLGRTLLASMRVLDGKCIFSVVTRRILNFYNASTEDLDGIIDELRVTKGVEVAILMHEQDEQKFKVSMRSNGNVDVSKIALFFGGGGHVKAAGCTMSGTYRDVINNLTLHIEKQLPGQ